MTVRATLNYNHLCMGMRLVATKVEKIPEILKTYYNKTYARIISKLPYQ